MTFCPPPRSGGQKTPSFLQDFCKNAQWRAKKLRERGSNTARPTEKCIGGLLIGARPVDFGHVASRFADFLLAFRSCRVAICGLPLGVSVVPVVPIVPIGARPVDFGASVVPVVPVVPIWSAACVAISARRSCRLCRSCRFGVLLVSRFRRVGRAGRVAICGLPLGVSS